MLVLLMLVLDGKIQRMFLLFLPRLFRTGERLSMGRMDILEAKNVAGVLWILFRYGYTKGFVQSGTKNFIVSNRQLSFRILNKRN